MANTFEFPLVQPLRFFQQTDLTGTLTTSDIDLSGFNPNYNTRPFDEDFFARNLQSWQDKVTYCQPFQKGDIVPIYFVYGNTLSDYEINILDENGDIYLTIPYTSFTALSVGGVAAAYYELPMYDLAEGFYFAQVSYNQPGEDIYFISEPFNVKDYHEGTMLLEYRNSYNDQNVLFEEFDFTFYLRVHAAITEMNPKVSAETYEDQPLNQTLLSAKPYREWKIVIGGNGNLVTEWFIDKANRAFSCDSLEIDGHAYTITSDGGFEATRAENHPLSEWSTTLRDSVNADSVEIEYYSSFDYHLGQAPLGDRFFLWAVTTNTASYVQDKEFTSLNSLIAWITRYFNAEFGLSGYAVINSEDEIIYKPNGIADYNWLIDANNRPALNTILENWISVDIDTSGLPLLDFQTAGLAQKNAAVWGDGTQDSNISTPTTSASNTYADIGIVRAYYYFNDQLDLLPSTNNGSILRLGGQIINNLTELSCENESIKFVENGLFLLGTGTLINFSLDGNKLPTNEVNKMIVMLQDSINRATIASSGTALLQQSPTAPPSSGSLAYVLAILRTNWTVTTD